MNVQIRNEIPEDYRAVEELTREAFWNLYVPGCNEHYLVHVLRNHPDFIPTLDFVAIHENRVIGNIMYTRSKVVDESGHALNTITFGPVSVLPSYQRMGVGSALIRHSIAAATNEGHKAVLIYGHPRNYCKHGFRSSKDWGVSNPEGKYPYALLGLELEKGVLQGRQGKYCDSSVYQIDPDAAAIFDAQFTPKEKGYCWTQEEFSIASRAYVL